MSTKEKTTEQLLLDYGYTEVAPGFFAPSRASSERWQKIDGGWACYQLPTPAFGGGAPWGLPIAELGLVKTPFRQLAQRGDGEVAHPEKDPELYDWVWPDERLREIYEHAVPQGANPWRKVDGQYVRE